MHEAGLDVHNGSTAALEEDTIPPTAEEIQALREADQLFKSNLFKLQVCSKMLRFLPC